LPVGPVFYPFKQYTSLTESLCRQIADAIESKGYCVEPDARFGNGKYDERHTLALFKPFEGDPIQPSTAYLGAANLLRLCMHITIADGQIDQVELDVFRRAIENQIGLTEQTINDCSSWNNCWHKNLPRHQKLPLKLPDLFRQTNDS